MQEVLFEFPFSSIIDWISTCLRALCASEFAGCEQLWSPCAFLLDDSPKRGGLFIRGSTCPFLFEWLLQLVYSLLSHWPYAILPSRSPPYSASPFSHPTLTLSGVRSIQSHLSLPSLPLICPLFLSSLHISNSFFAALSSSPSNSHSPPHSFAFASHHYTFRSFIWLFSSCCIPFES